MDEQFKQWDSLKLSQYLTAKGLGDYAEMFLENSIDGKVAHRLDDQNLKEMGVSKVGDRLKLMEALEALKKAQQQQARELVIWEGKELLYVSWFDRICKTCCGCFPDDPSMYKLTNSHFEIKLVQPRRCGPCKLPCLSKQYHIDNVDLSHITDADVKGVPPSCFHQCCCCGKVQEHVILTTSVEGNKVLKLPKGEGQVAARKIKNQVEVMQRMERS